LAEPNWKHLSEAETSFCILIDNGELLGLSEPHWQYHASTWPELLEQCWRWLLGCSGHQDLVVGRVLPPTTRSVSDTNTYSVIPLRSRSLGVLFADEMEAVGDEALDLDAVVVEMGEETLDRRLEGGIGREVLVPQHRILQQPPEPLD
jgi:hypothetical protein